MRRRRPHCGCVSPVSTVVHPVKENCIDCCSEEVVKHIHPSHTTVMNHHLVKNVHVFPHSTSVGNTFNEVDVYGGSFNVPAPPPGSVAGAMAPPPYGMAPGMGPAPGAVMGAATGPGYGMGPGPNAVMGAAMGPGPNAVMGAAMGPYGKPHKWC